jgi:hypothetical protein
MPTAIGTVLTSATGAEWVHAAPPSQREGDRSEQGHRIAGTMSSYFGVTPRISGTIIADMAKQTAITR